jgi:F0F1-type ATP synthase assembly protein I
MDSRAPDDEAAREMARETRAPASWSLLEPARGLQASMRSAGPVAAASYTLIGAILLLGGLGYLADSWLGTDPWLLLVGLLLGLVVGFYELARIVWR